jgi:hypothetical protein
MLQSQQLCTIKILNDLQYITRPSFRLGSGSATTLESRIRLKTKSFWIHYTLLNLLENIILICANVMSRIMSYISQKMLTDWRSLS